MTAIKGVHPYAEMFPMLPESELIELAESIAANGLRNPIVVTPKGLIIDGRNRAAACEKAGVKPATEVYRNDDIAEYIIDCNSSRRHMSTGARAMSSALVLEADGRRENGRWKRGSVAIGESANSTADWQSRLKECGLVLDHAHDLASLVIQEEIALDAAYQKACDIRDEERLALEDAERAEQEEADAQASLEEHEATELLSKVADGTYDNHREAWAIWLERNREEKARLDRERRDHEDAIRRDANRVQAFLSGFDGAYSMREHPYRDEVLHALKKRERTRFLRIESEMTWPPTRL
jgi:hypothetical protein